MELTKIQWCHSTINPVMGCDGCELWPPASKFVDPISAKLVQSAGLSKAVAKRLVSKEVGERDTSGIYSDREEIAAKLCDSLGLGTSSRSQIVDVIREGCKCYAGMLGTFRGGHKGYADRFEEPKIFPGRMENAASWGPPSAKDISEKPWIKGLPRLIFISDMGDALSRGVSFEYLRDEILFNAVSETGSKHVWLWLSKRPDRMAKFAVWLRKEGHAWPDNLVSMTTVTCQKYASRADQLRKVPSRLKGLSVEPLSEAVDLDLEGIDWVIVGGGSDALADPFHVEWALSLREKCQNAGIAFFLKQLGRKPFFNDKPFPLRNRHGGDWEEWPEDWRCRAFPEAFRTVCA